MVDLCYIECAGVRVPSDWSVDQLQEALAKRKIRFQKAHEKEIMAVFGEAIQLKASLEKNIHNLNAEVARLEKYVNEKRQKVLCPGCGMKWTEAPAYSAENSKKNSEKKQ